MQRVSKKNLYTLSLAELHQLIINSTDIYHAAHTLNIDYFSLSLYMQKIEPAGSINFAQLQCLTPTAAQYIYKEAYQQLPRLAEISIDNFSSTQVIATVRSYTNISDAALVLYTTAESLIAYLRRYKYKSKHLTFKTIHQLSEPDYKNLLAMVERAIPSRYSSRAINLNYNYTHKTQATSDKILNGNNSITTVNSDSALTAHDMTDTDFYFSATAQLEKQLQLCPSTQQLEDPYASDEDLSPDSFMTEDSTTDIDPEVFAAHPLAMQAEINTQELTITFADINNDILDAKLEKESEQQLQRLEWENSILSIVQNPAGFFHLDKSKPPYQTNNNQNLIYFQP